MSKKKSESEGEATYPNCRCVDLTKPVCFYCEDTLDEENDHNHEASDDSDSGDDDNPWVSYIESRS